ncbi:lipocalin family protein [Bosea sp. 124]|uniref:lipocalin family protein n=1 Tax=Bosea sp. 124 TaxID=2135642 RepID=UPI000D399748|nr:lipocalin family protein [Bosea sp. 124]PTM40272.1 apolipoprotein D and lipocalin family protein [Bosea sp. 124]
MKRPIATAFAAMILLAGCAGVETSGGAPQPARTIDAARLYSGLWHEIARRPMAITDGCVAGATEYKRGAGGKIEVLDSCRMGTPAGELKTIGGPGEILDPGTNAKLRVTYTVFGVVPVVRDYWILDRAADYSWFISADPTLKDLYIFTRNPQISAAERNRLVKRASDLGYDISKLEFPEQPKR